MWVPIDDEHCWVYNWMYARDGRPIAEDVSARGEDVRSRHRRTCCPAIGPSATANDYLIDRQVQRTQTYTGIPGVNTQDMAVRRAWARSTIARRSTWARRTWR